MLSAYYKGMSPTWESLPLQEFDSCWWPECYANPRKAENYRQKFWITPNGGQDDLQSTLNRLVGRVNMMKTADTWNNNT